MSTQGESAEKTPTETIRVQRSPMIQQQSGQHSHTPVVTPPVSIPETSKRQSGSGTADRVKDKGKARDEQVSSTTINTLLQEKIAQQQKPLKSKVSIKNMVSENLRNKYASLEHIGTGVNMDCEWKDSMIKNLQHVNVFQFQSIEGNKQDEFLKGAIESLYKGTSVLSVGYILFGAAGLRSCEDPRKYALIKPKMNTDEDDVSELDPKIVYHPRSGSPSIPEWESSDASRRSLSYVCTALLRLATKDHENMTRAWNHIKLQYSNFYQENIAVDLPTPDLECLRGVREILQSKRILRNTIGCFLLAYCDTEGQDRGLCRMGFELHMAYTGMHAYSLLLFCAAKLQTPLNILIGMLSHAATKEALKAAEHLLLTYEHPLSDEKKAAARSARTWRYARVFDSTKFEPLQTKNCMLLVGILAYVAQKCGMGGLVMSGTSSRSRGLLHKTMNG